jgi:hypothetical protein
VVLEEGTRVVGRRTVIGSMRPGRSTQRRPFTFRVPAGTYVVSGGPSSHVTVVIEPGETTKVTLPDVCAKGSP